MILPTIHSNGTNASDLLTDNWKAKTAVDQAVEVICKAEFNARDYYPQGMDKWDLALAERRKHIQALRDASQYFEALAMHCADNGGELKHE